MKIKHQFIHFTEAVNVPLSLFKGDLFLFSPPSFRSERYAVSCVCKEVLKVKKTEVKELLPPTGSSAPELPETCTFKSVTL